MKARLRSLSLDFVRDASFLKNGSQGVETNVLEGLRVNILETLALLELAFIAGLVSEMNFTILKREYTALRDTLEVKKVSRESRTDTILGDNFFGAPDATEKPKAMQTFPAESPVETSAAPSFPKGHSIGQTGIAMSDRNTKRQPGVSLGTDAKSGPKIGTHYSPSVVPRAMTDVAKESRRARILKLVKDNREVTIKDITAHFTDLSEKTIQRELVSLVEAGVLKKFGERRWSRYTVV